MLAPVRTSILLTTLLLLGTGSAAAQSSNAEASAPSETAERPTSENCETDLSNPLFPDSSGGRTVADNTGPDASMNTSGDKSTRPTPAERRVRDILSQKGIHVVRLWAPWCSNSTGEMAQGWKELVEANQDVSFTFVTVWNNGNGGASTIQKYGIPLSRVTEVVPAPPEQGRLDTFMGYAVNWVPSTWIFRTPATDEPPERSFALNYGEMEQSTLQTLIDVAQADW